MRTRSTMTPVWGPKMWERINKANREKFAQRERARKMTNAEMIEKMEASTDSLMREGAERIKELVMEEGCTKLTRWGDEKPRPKTWFNLHLPDGSSCLIQGLGDAENGEPVYMWHGDAEDFVSDNARWAPCPAPPDWGKING